jgi:hypothetical protein
MAARAKVSRIIMITAMTFLTAAGLATHATAEDTTAPDDPTAEELKLANAWVPKDQQLQFGAVPLGYVRDAAPPTGRQ